MKQKIKHSINIAFCWLFGHFDSFKVPGEESSKEYCLTCGRIFNIYGDKKSKEEVNLWEYMKERDQIEVDCQFDSPYAVLILWENDIWNPNC